MEGNGDALDLSEIPPLLCPPLAMERGLAVVVYGPTVFEATPASENI